MRTWRRRVPGKRLLAIVSLLVLLLACGRGWLPVLDEGRGVATSSDVSASVSVTDDTGAVLPQAGLDAVEGLLGSEVGELVSQEVTRSRMSLPVPEAAIEILTSHEAARDCLLVKAGYLDLNGQVWSCLVQGGDWVEIQVVRALDEEGSSEVFTIRMDAKAWEKGLSALEEEGL